ncbi:MAG: YihY/virulence factor BrkB family protein [Proteobacteria bacterium]|nr:YihY/virulence factor BrkB family protein [Pseudomonadota bacterium]
MRFIVRLVRSFVADNCFVMAESISFCALLAVIPIAMFMVSIAGYFLGASNEAFQRIVEVAGDVLPVGREIFVANLQSVLDQRASLGVVSIFILVFVSTILVGSIERALDLVFKTQTRRNFFHSRLLAIALIFWVTLLLSLPTMARILEGLLDRYGFGFPLSGLMSGRGYFFLVAFLAYLMMIVIVPNRKVYVRYALVGGAFFSVGLGAAKWLFIAYMSFSMQRYNIVYGSLAAAVLFVIWIYYLSMLMLVSAELVAAVQERRIFHRKKGEAR